MSRGVYLRLFVRAHAREGFVLVCVVLGLLLATFYVVRTEKTYRASAQIFVTPTQSTNGALAAGQTFVQSQMQSYASIVTSPLVLGPVSENRELEQRDGTIGTVTADAPLNQVLLNIHVEGMSARRVAKVANAVADQSVVVIEGLQRSAVRLTVTHRAVTPSAPSAPRTRLILAVGLIAGLVIGLILVISLERATQRIRSVGDVEATTDAPVLGIIPDTGSADVRSVLVDPGVQGLRREAFSQLRASLQFVDVDNPPKVLAVTSAASGEGKSSVAVNLAIELADVGLAVCLVEADLRRPTLAEVLGIDGTAGLTTLLLGAKPSTPTSIQPSHRSSNPGEREVGLPAGSSDEPDEAPSASPSESDDQDVTPTEVDPLAVVGQERHTRSANEFQPESVDGPALLAVTEPTAQDEQGSEAESPNSNRSATEAVEVDDDENVIHDQPVSETSSASVGPRRRRRRRVGPVGPVGQTGTPRTIRDSYQGMQAKARSHEDAAGTARSSDGPNMPASSDSEDLAEPRVGAAPAEPEAINVPESRIDEPVVLTAGTSEPSGNGVISCNGVNGIEQRVGENLTVITSGPLPPNPPVVLASRQFRAVLGGLRDRFDYVIVDTGSLLSVADGAEVVAASDAALIVVRSRATSRRQLAASVRVVERVDKRVAGIVLCRTLPASSVGRPRAAG